MVVECVWQRSILDSAAALHYTSDSERQLNADLYYRAPTVFISNGLSPMVPDRDSSALALLPSGAHPVNGYHGPVDQKGLPVLLGTFRRILVNFPNARLLLIGPDSRGHMRELQARYRT